MLNFSNQIGLMEFNENFIIVVKVIPYKLQTSECSTFHTCCDDYLCTYCTQGCQSGPKSTSTTSRLEAFW